MFYRISLLSTIIVILRSYDAKAQNQSPPGLRRPPFVVVPPAGERHQLEAASDRIDVIEHKPDSDSFTQVNRDEGILQTSHHPPDFLIHQTNNQPFINQALEQFSNSQTKNMKNVIDRKLDASCLECICKASSNCENLECLLVSDNMYYCGPYHISWGYWADSGKPGDVPKDPSAFEDCLNNKECAERSIRGYMTKFARDCNGDGDIDCTDFARVHKAGPTNCNGSWIDGTEYWKRYTSCSGTGLDFRSGPKQ